jgi:DNA polymerase-3 subunit delta'
MAERPKNQEPAPPHFFRDILGQERVLAYLKTAWRQGRLAHAYLFIGPEGVGKASVARALAAALNCTQPLPEHDACGECPSCRRLLAGTHPDFVVLTPEEGKTQIKIEYVRDFRKLTAYPPLGGGWRVALFKPAEALTAISDAAANALLKTLEEPPEHNLIILAATVEGDLLPTVVSRCQKLPFSPLPPALVAQELARRRGLTPAQAALLAALSGGSLGRALALDPEAMFNQRRQVLADLEQIGQGSATAVLEWAQRLAKARPDKSRPELDHFLALAQLWYRDLLLLHYQAPARMLGHQDQQGPLEKAAAAGSPRAWFAQCAALAAAHRHLQANLNPELTLDILGLRLQQEKLPL